MDDCSVRVVTTRDVSEEDVNSLLRDLNPVLPAGRGHQIALFSADPPSYLEIVGRAPAWVPILAASSAFLAAFAARLGQKAADELWDNRRKLLEATLLAAGKAAESLTKVARAVLAAKRRLRRTQIGLGIAAIENPNWPAILWVRTTDEIELTWLIALVAANAAQIESSISLKVREEQGPYGPTMLSVTPTGTLAIGWIGPGGKQIDVIVGPGGVKHRVVGYRRFSLFVLPEGDHFRWQVNRTDMNAEANDHFGERMATGTAQNETEAWGRVESWVDEYLQGAPRMESEL